LVKVRIGEDPRHPCGPKDSFCCGGEQELSSTCGKTLLSSDHGKALACTRMTDRKCWKAATRMSKSRSVIRTLQRASDEHESRSKPWS
jgi:hypothetical protein